MRELANEKICFITNIFTKWESDGARFFNGNRWVLQRLGLYQ